MMKNLIIVVFFLILGLTSYSQTGEATKLQTGLEDGLVGYWSFDDGMANDRSGNNHHGEIIGYVPFLNGEHGKNVKFFGNEENYIKIPHSSKLSLLENFTFCAWMKINTYENAFPVHKSGGNGFKLQRDGRVFEFGDKHSGGYTKALSEDEFPLNEWHYVSVVMNSSLELSYYLDGKLMSKENATISKFDKKLSPLVFGRYLSPNSKNGYPFNGCMDEVRIYNRALNQKEIEKLYNVGLGSELAMDITEVSLNIPFNSEFSKMKKPRLSGNDVKSIKKRAKKGDLEALNIYGDMHYFGYGDIEIDKSKAIKNYKTAANKGNKIAQHKLATIYRNDYEDMDEAVKYYKNAVSQSYEPAIYDLSIVYINGIGVSKDYQKAKELLEQIPNNTEAQIELAKLKLSPDIMDFDMQMDLQKGKDLLKNAGHLEIYDDWIGRISTFGKLRFITKEYPYLFPSVNTEINFYEGDELKTLFAQLDKYKDVLGEELVLTYKSNLLDNRRILNTVISQDYEDEKYELAKQSGSIVALEVFCERFPNSIYKELALQTIQNIEKGDFQKANEEYTVIAYQQFIKKHPESEYAKEAQLRIDQIEFEKKLAIERKKEEDRLAKIRFEQNRKDRIRNASIGDRLCFSQGWKSTETFLWQTYKTTNYTMSIICFIEQVNGENYQIRVADVSSSHEGEYSRPEINGVRVSKGDVLWVKPLGHKDWHRCD